MNLHVLYLSSCMYRRQVNVVLTNHQRRAIKAVSKSDTCVWGDLPNPHKGQNRLIGYCVAFRRYEPCLGEPIVSVSWVWRHTEHRRIGSIVRDQSDSQVHHNSLTHLPKLQWWMHPLRILHGNVIGGREILSTALQVPRCTRVNGHQNTGRVQAVRLA